ncbi:MAG: ABC transporter permease [Anaerolineaceae bacterium]
MRPSWHKLFSDLFVNPVRTILVVLSITIGLFAVGMITTIHLIIQKDMAEGYAQIVPPNILISVTNIDEDMVKNLVKLDGIASSEGARKFNARIKNVDGDWVKTEITARKSFVSPEIIQLKLIEGSLELSEGEILIDQFKYENVLINEEHHVFIELPSGIIKEISLAGKSQDQTIGFDTGGGGFFIAPIQGYILMETLPHLEQALTFNQIYLTVTPENGNFNQIQKIANNVLDFLDENEIGVVQTTVHESATHPNSIYVNAISALLLVLGFLIVFLSSFLIINTLSALMQQQIQQVGIMKSLGATKKQIVSLYMILIFFYGMIAFGVALPLSRISAFRMVSFLASRVNFEFLGNRFLLFPILILAVIALIIPQLAGAFPIQHGVRIKVTEALSGFLGQRSAIFGKLALNKLRISRPVLISIRNTFRNRTRLILTLITLTLGGSIFISTFNVQIALKNHTSKIGQYFLADVNLDFNQLYRISKVQNDLKSVDQIDVVEGWAFAPSQIILDNGQAGETVRLVGPPINSEMIKANLLKGRWMQIGDHNAIVLNEVFQTNFPNLDVGDTLKLRVNNEETEWVIIGFFQLAGKSTGYIAYTDFDSLAKMNKSFFHTRIFRIASKYKNLNIYQQKSLANEISTVLRQKGYHVLQVEAGLSLLESTTVGLDIITIFLFVMALLIAIVGSIGLMGAMSLNVIERTRELGVMRAIGASNFTILRSVLFEGLLVGELSWFLSIFLAIPMTKILCDSLSIALFDAIGLFAFTWKGILIWLGVVTFLSIISSLLPAVNATRLTIREVLAYE